jgi:hypothetical protein
MLASTFPMYVVELKRRNEMTDLIAAFLLMMGYGPNVQQIPNDGGVIAQGGGIPVRPPVSASE